MSSVEPPAAEPPTPNADATGVTKKVVIVLGTVTTLLTSATAVVTHGGDLLNAINAAFGRSSTDGGATGRKSAPPCDPSAVTFDASNTTIAVRVQYRHDEKATADGVAAALRRAGFRDPVEIELALDNVNAPDKSPGVILIKPNANGRKFAEPVRELVLAACAHKRTTEVTVFPADVALVNGDLQIDLF
ncbi:MAG: hypothetical protein KGM42_20505 [Hyphomicrobiales bacterium]|nr:hypothetical protein [Hyphomicrobiales bacterium]